MFGIDPPREDHSRRPARVLVVGALDPSGARGITADLRLLAAAAVQGSAVATALVGVQPKRAATPWLPISPPDVESQLRLATSGPIDGCKLAVSGDEQVLRTVSDGITQAQLRPVVDVNVLDRANQILLSHRALDALRGYLIPVAEVVVVNSDELDPLTGRRAYDRGTMREGAKRIFDLGPRYVLVTGGRIEDHAVDVLYDGSGFLEFGHDRITRSGLRATGATLSAGIAAYLARGEEVFDAISTAKELVTRAIDDAIACPWGSVAEPHAKLWRATETLVRTVPIESSDDNGQ